jgi:RNA:NAD 2'-phosphotransferase (TPT1/KptA family)
MRSGRFDRNKNTGKFISLILRHKPETMGITLEMAADGYRFFEPANHV